MRDVPSGLTLNRRRVATVRVTAHNGRHRADTDNQAWGKDSEIQIKSFNKIERPEELDGGAAGRGRIATA